MIARARDRLGHRNRCLAFGLAALASVVVALALTAAGAWPILPYSLIEVAALGAAFVVLDRRSRRYERLVVAGDRVIVERGDGVRLQRREFNRWWLRVELRETGAAGVPALELRYAGEALDFGSALPPAARIEVARALRRLTTAR